MNSTAKLVLGLNFQSFTGNQRIIGDLEVTSLITAPEFVATELTPTINGSLTTKSYVDTQVALKQNLITDGSLTIDKTSGLQDALNAKQATITTATDLDCNSITTGDLEVNGNITLDKTTSFDTIVIRRFNEADTTIINLNELQVWVNGSNILFPNSASLTRYFALWRINRLPLRLIKTIIQFPTYLTI